MGRSFLAAGLLLVLAAGCRNNPDRADFVVLNGAEPETLDPALITGQPEGRVANALFEGLTAFGSNGKAGPGVAESWEISPDKRHYTFHLRDNARWSNGDPVTAQDFAESWRRTLTPATTSEYSYQLHYIRNARPFNEGKITDFRQVGVRATNNRTLEVELESPTPFFLDLCAFVTLLPTHAPSIRKFGDSWTKPGHLVSNGAYSLREWRINHRIRLEKNPHYWNRANVAMNRVDLLPISRANTAFNFYASGLADLILDKGLVPPSLMGELAKRPDFHSAPFLGTYFLRFNAKRPPFNDPRVRMAISLAIDRDTIVHKITRAGELPATSFVPPGMQGYQPPEGQRRNPDRARQLLAEAGFPGGRGFPSANYLYSEGELNEAIAVEIQSMLDKELGIKIQLSRQEWKVYLNSMSTLDYDLCRSSWVGDYCDPNTFLDMFVTDGGNNRTGWSNPAYDALIAQAAREPDPEKRLSILREAESILIEREAPICPLYFYVGIQFYDAKRIAGIEPNLLDEHPLRLIRLKNAPHSRTAISP